jgi:uncharacterized protein YkwD
MKKLQILKFFLFLNLFWVSGCEIFEEPKPKKIIALAGNLDFGSTDLGKALTKEVEIINKSETELTIKKIIVPTGFVANFSGIIPPKSSKKATITFLANQIGLTEGIVSVESDKTEGENTMAIRAEAKDNKMAVIFVDGNLDFGKIEVGQSRTQTITIRNLGNATLNISNISLPNGFISTATPVNINPTNTVAWQIIFRPTVAGVIKEQLRITNNSNQNPLLIAINAEVVAPATVIPNPVNINRIVQLVNQIRATGCNCGTSRMPPVSPISWNNRLANAAQLHSEDMARNRYFDHTGLNGSTVGSRIIAQGYTPYVTWAENIYRGSTKEDDAFQAWLNSPGHCLNMMNGTVNEMGVGHQSSYWTMVFGKLR